MNRSLKRVLPSLFAMAILLSSFAFRMSAAEASRDEWVKEYYKDKFGDVTDEFYLVNSSRFKGTNNNETISNGICNFAVYAACSKNDIPIFRIIIEVC